MSHVEPPPAPPRPALSPGRSASCSPLIGPLLGDPVPAGYPHPSSLEYPTSVLAGPPYVLLCIPSCRDILCTYLRWRPTSSPTAHTSWARVSVPIKDPHLLPPRFPVPRPPPGAPHRCPPGHPRHFPPPPAPHHPVGYQTPPPPGTTPPSLHPTP